MYRTLNIRSFEIGLLFRNDEFQGLLESGRHTLFDPFGRVRVELASLRDPWLVNPQLDIIVRSGALEGRARVLDLAEHERALVWVDGRVERLLSSGLYALWTTLRRVEVEVFDVRQARLEHRSLDAVISAPGAACELEEFMVPEGYRGALYQDGALAELLEPGRYAFWRRGASVRVAQVSVREAVLDINGQDIMTRDNVTLRVNAVVVYRVRDVERALTAVEDVRTSLYRDAQLALREVVGERDLDGLFAEKDAVANALGAGLQTRAEHLGLADVRVGIRDVILPGDMRELLNRVTEAKKSAEAALITRREETAAMRSLSNTAKLMENNPTLMRLRELEVLSTIAEKASLTVVLGEKGLTDRVINMI